MNNASLNAGTPKSPLSSLPPKKIRDLSRAFILEQLETYFAAKPPAGAAECDYSIWECAGTGLQFASPMLPGNILLYQWLAGFDSYYPGVRWEYKKTRQLLEAECSAGRKDFKLLDVGCGKGDFLGSLDFVPGERKFALDLNEPAIRECRRRGFQAFCGTMEGAMKAGVLHPSEFPLVTAFHCLEHVADPVEFARSLINVTVPGGRIFISTPYSPMSFESGWFDVLNHPPHHMTRWNLKSYEKLAAILGMKMRWFAPPSSALRRAVNAFQILQYGPNRPIGGAKLLKDLLFHLPELARHYQEQRQRQPVPADVILVELTVP